LTCSGCGAEEVFSAPKRYMLVQVIDRSLWHTEPTADGMGHTAVCGNCHGTSMPHAAFAAECCGGAPVTPQPDALHELRRLRRAAEDFDTFSEAFATCRDRDAPPVVNVAEQCNDCCRESEGHPKRLHKVYPSGYAVALAIQAEVRS
jgi:hypothetical protein